MKTLAARACRAAICSLLAYAPVANAFDLDPSELRGKSSKEPVTVLQNRYFTKVYRPEAGLLVGAVMDEAYLETQIYGARSGLFLTEWLGIEVQMMKTRVSASQDRKALDGKKYLPLPEDDPNSGNATPDGEYTTVSPEPEVNPIRSMTDFNANLTPFYGKLNLLNKYIIYTDICFTGGLSRVETDQGEKLATVLGMGQRFYMGQNLSTRINFMDRIFTEERAGNNARRNSYSVDLGASWFFN
jgi:outer membrane beta-barrel protein